MHQIKKWFELATACSWQPSQHRSQHTAQDSNIPFFTGDFFIFFKGIIFFTTLFKFSYFNSQYNLKVLFLKQVFFFKVLFNFLILAAPLATRCSVFEGGKDRVKNSLKPYQDLNLKKIAYNNNHPRAYVNLPLIGESNLFCVFQYLKIKCNRGER